VAVLAAERMVVDGVPALHGAAFYAAARP